MESIFMLVYYGHFDYDTVCQMPVKMRNKYIEMLIDILKKENEQEGKILKSILGRK